MAVAERRDCKDFVSIFVCSDWQLLRVRYVLTFHCFCVDHKHMLHMMLGSVICCSDFRLVNAFSVQHVAPSLACRQPATAVFCSGGQYILYMCKEFLMECRSSAFKFLHELIYNKLCYMNNNDSIKCLIK